MRTIPRFLRASGIVAAIVTWLAVGANDPAVRAGGTPSARVALANNPEELQDAARKNVSAKSAPIPTSEPRQQTPATSFPVIEIPTEGQHPRLWLNAADVERLQTWAVPKNPVWPAFQVVLQTSVKHYVRYFPRGRGNRDDVPADPFPDSGDTQGYGTFKGSNVPTAVESHAFVLAFGSLLTTNENQKAQYAGMARNLIMHALKQTAEGHQKDAAYRGSAFAIYNRGKGVQKFPLVVDWIYPYLTAEDKATIRTAFLLWAHDCLHASTTGGDHPEPVGVVNDLLLFPHGKPYRMSANNYYISHACVLTHMSLCLDLADDPEGQLRSYLANATGAWLYQMYGMFGDAEQVCADFGLKNVSDFGLASGGITPEGPALYGESFGWMFEMFLSLQSSGCTDAKKFGPQIQLLSAPFTSRYIQAYLSWVDVNPTTLKKYQGGVYLMPGFGDCLVAYADPSLSAVMGSLAVLQARQGNVSNQNAVSWAIQNLPAGGGAAFTKRVANPWTFGPQQAVFAFLALDPKAPRATDPRKNYPAVFIDQKQGTLIAHKGTSACFYRCCWASINHQQPDAGSFGLFRNGEWLTKPISNYDHNHVGINSICMNTLSVQNQRETGDPPKSFLFYNDYMTGSQYWLDAGAADPNVTFSHAEDYVYATSDFTGLYNKVEKYAPAKSAIKVSQVQRLFLWLPERNLAVTYDRVASRAGLFKRWNNATAKEPKIRDGVAFSESNSGNQTYTVQTLLPADRKLEATELRSKMNPPAEGDSMAWVLTVEGANTPAEMRFLHVMQGTDKGSEATPASLVQSQAGTPLEGSVIGDVALLFLRNAGDELKAATIELPADVKTVYVMGLKTNTQYSSKISGRTVTVTAGTGVAADEAGLVKLEF
jgi:hypothetical protein